MHIGLIGGIGVAATDFYYRHLVQQMHDRGADLDMTIVHADAPTLLKNFLAADQAAQAAIYVRLTDRLKAAGAECVAVTSIGGHFCIDTFIPLSPLPVIDLRVAIAERLAADGFRRIGLLGTNTAMRTGLYGHLSAFELVPPDEDRLEEVHQAYVDTALSGVATPERTSVFWEIGRRMVEQQGADVVLLAGTDLFLAFENRDCGFPVIDGAMIHVDRLADLASGRAA